MPYPRPHPLTSRLEKLYGLRTEGPDLISQGIQDLIHNLDSKVSKVDKVLLQMFKEAEAVESSQRQTSATQVAAKKKQEKRHTALTEA